jgi:hypothetical protein
MEDRFKIKRKKEFKIPKKLVSFIKFLLFLLIYILFLFLFSQKGTFLKNGANVYPLSYKIGEIENKIFYSTSKAIYFLEDEKYINFQYFITDFYVNEDKIFVFSDNLIILNKDLKVIKEIKKVNYYPKEIYFFTNNFAVKYIKKDSLSIQFSLFDKKSFKELKTIKFENLTSMPFSYIYSNGEKILIFQNDGDLLILNFNNEILLQKNVRPKDEILFNPKSFIDEKNEEIILYWQSYSYTTNSILFISFNGDIKLKLDIKSDINDLILYDNKKAILLDSGILFLSDNNEKGTLNIPFLKPVRILNVDGNLVSIWEFNLFYSDYKLLRINNKNYIFEGKFKDIIFNNGEFFILIDSRIYKIKI